jgi:hypothetical protein
MNVRILLNKKQSLAKVRRNTKKKLWAQIFTENTAIKDERKKISFVSSAVQQFVVCVLRFVVYLFSSSLREIAFLSVFV